MADIEITLRGPLDRDEGLADSLIADLKELGSLDELEWMQESWPPADLIVDTLAVTLTAATTKEIVEAVADAVKRWVRSKPHERETHERKAVIYGPGGEVLAEVTRDEGLVE